MVSTALPGEHGSEWRGRPSAPVEGARAIVTDRERVFEAHPGGCWWHFDPGDGAAGLERLALRQLDRELMEPYTVYEVAVERVS